MSAMLSRRHLGLAAAALLSGCAASPGPAVAQRGASPVSVISTRFSAA